MARTLHQYIILLFNLSIVFAYQNMSAQNNGVFNGGKGIGWAQGIYHAQSNNGIFHGGKEDGLSVSIFTIKSHSPVFAGGSNDGFSYSRFEIEDHNQIFAGGGDDGADQRYFQQQLHNSIFFGGSDDGADHNERSEKTDNLIFAGGKQDGYSQSRISKLIWVGTKSKDWLMAANWNITRVPNVVDHVVIPTGLVNYPALTGKILINQQGDFLYTCRSIDVLKEAEITGNEAAWFINFGQFNILGLVNILGNTNFPSQNLEGGNIHVSGSGLLHLGN